MKNVIRPPKIFLRFFRWFCHPGIVDYIEGDLLEVYARRVRQSGKLKADLIFMRDVLLLFRPGIIKPAEGTYHINTYGMYKNYLKMTFRVFNREKLYSLINAFGLTLGFTCCLIIALFIKDELSYDTFHENSDRIYRISAAYMRQGQWEPYASNSWRTAELIKNNYPEVEELVRIMPDNNTLFEYRDKRFVEERIAWADSNFFSLFNFPLTEGNSAEALTGPNKVVISQSSAVKYFGNEDPIGKVLKLSDYPIDLQVSAIMQDMPANSHFHFDFLISGETIRQAYNEALFTNVGWDSQFVYARLTSGTNPQRIEATFPDFINNNLNFWKSTTFKMFLQPLDRIHLESNIGREFEANGSLVRIYTFSAIAIFILVIACVNYMNLTTARSLRRAKEVGMRKTLGAKKTDLLGQFLTESFMMTFIAIAFAVLFTALLLPQFNEFAGKEISRDALFNPEILVGLLISLFGIGIGSGFYPALVLASFKPLHSMKEGGHSGKAGLVLRKGLVLLQFAISIGLITASAIVFQQWNYMRTKDLGINKDMILSVPLQTINRRQLGSFTQELVSNPAIKKAGFSNMRMPGWIGQSTSYDAQDVNETEEVNKSMKLVRIDYDFLSTVEARLTAGRNFSREFPVDTLSSVLLNESAVAQLGWKDPIGKWITFRETKFTVIGVVKDFHFESLHRKIPPIIFTFSPRAFNWAYLKIENKNIPATLAQVKKTYSRFVTNREFTYTFLNDDIDRQYQAEQKFTQVFTLFTVLAIIIACLGTFGLISFTAERKSKEIGIRKVLGASTSSVSFLLIKEFIILLLISSIIAWPVTWYFLNGWLEEFIYRTSIGVSPFIAATVLAACIVVLTTGFRAVKAAIANPVNSLRQE